MGEAVIPPLPPGLTLNEPPPLPEGLTLNSPKVKLVRGGNYFDETMDESGVPEDGAFDSFKKGLAKSTLETVLGAKELMGMEVIIMRENENLKNLKSNVHENFALIEDMYRDLFKQFNESYTYYAKAHPKSDLNKTIWVDKQDEKLKALKMKQLDLLYKSYTSE